MHPVTTEIADDLVPFVDAKQDAGLFFKETLPSMKQRIGERFGLVAPPLFFSGNSGLLPGHFRVLLREVPLVEGSMNTGARYALVSDARTSAAEETRLVVDPVTGEPCMMVDGDEAERLQVSGVTVWTVPEFFARLLERILIDHLHRLATVEQIRQMLDGWSEHGHTDLVRRKLPTAADQIVFGRLFRALLRDGIQITPSDQIATTLLNALPDPPLVPETFAETLAQMRLTLRQHLAGRRPGVEQIPVEPALEERLREAMRGMDAEACRLLIEELRTLLDPPGERRRSFVVRDPGVRAWLQRLADPWFPGLKVMTEAEMKEDAVAAI